MKALRISCTLEHKGRFWCILAGLTFAAAVLSLLIGSVAVAPGDVLWALLGQDTESVAARIVLYARLPRTCAAMLAGAALAVAGCVIQTVLDNPLASPGVIGVNSGAGLAVAAVCAIAPAAQQWTPLVAFCGALLSAVLVMGIASLNGASRMTVVLAGVALSNLFSALIDGVVTAVPDALTGVTDFRIGGFRGLTGQQLIPAAVLIGVGLVVVFSFAGRMDILSLGSEVARSLGLSVRSVRMILLLAAAMLTGAAVSFSGLIGFVGLIVPHAMRRITGGKHGSLLAASALGGACFVVLCDLAARVIAAPFELPVGIVLSVAGCPFFLWLLLRQRKGGPV